MTAVMLLDAWIDTLIVTGALVLAILLIRKPFARHFGPRLAYALWLVPALRLILPPLPFADPVVPQAAAMLPETTVVHWAVGPQMVEAQSSALSYSWSLPDLMPIAFAAWVAGMAAVLVTALLADRRFRRDVLDDAVELEPLGDIRLMMTDAVDGPVAFGLIRRFVAVPHDFFARYAAEERALAIDHELAHHRHGDLWANAAALLCLAVQWFNPLAWRAIRAFRFDQEAACDARVLTMEAREARDVRTVRYATAIAKAAVGARLSLAAPMAIHDNLQERLTMLMQQDISKRRSLIGRLCVGSTALAVLATTATLVPAGIAQARAQSDAPHETAPPLDAAAKAPKAVEAPNREPQVVIVTAHGSEVSKDIATTDGERKTEIRRFVVRDSADGGDGKKQHFLFTPTEGGTAGVRQFQFRMPGALSRDDILATLKEQGISGKRADAIADKLDVKRKDGFRDAMAPVAAMAVMPSLRGGAGWTSADGKMLTKCGDGAKATPMVDREEKDGSKHSRVLMLRCGGGTDDKAARLSALKKARERFVETESARHMSEEIRAGVAADLDKAIADLEKSDR